MEPPRIELGSAKPSIAPLRPFPHLHLLPDGAPSGGLSISRLRLVSPSVTSFLVVSSLSSCHFSLLLPGCDKLAPCAIASHDVSLHLDVRLRERTAGWQFWCLPLFTSLSNSGRGNHLLSNVETCRPLVTHTVRRSARRARSALDVTDACYGVRSCAL